jgi:hypothetical protein
VAQRGADLLEREAGQGTASVHAKLEPLGPRLTQLDVDDRATRAPGQRCQIDRRVQASGFALVAMRRESDPSVPAQGHVELEWTPNPQAQAVDEGHRG